METPNSPNKIDYTHSVSSLKDIIYLDKGRLHSYSSQVDGGLSLLRRIVQRRGGEDVKASEEKLYEKSIIDIEKHSDLKEAGLNASFASGSLTYTNAKESTSGTRDSIKDPTYRVSEFRNEETIIEQARLDDLLIWMESDLIKRGVLNQLSSQVTHGLVRFKAPGKLMDNKLIMRSLRDRVNYRDLSSLTSNEDEAYAYLSSMKQSDIDNLDLGSDYSFYFFHDNEYIFCPMNIDMISGRASQMRSAYYGESHLLTVIGFLSEKCSDFPLPTMVKHLDIAQNLNSRLWSNVKRIIPLAIYTEIPF